jgi:hypothetical protein
MQLLNADQWASSFFPRHLKTDRRDTSVMAWRDCAIHWTPIYINWDVFRAWMNSPIRRRLCFVPWTGRRQWFTAACRHLISRRMRHARGWLLSHQTGAVMAPTKGSDISRTHEMPSSCEGWHATMRTQSLMKSETAARLQKKNAPQTFIFFTSLFRRTRRWRRLLQKCISLNRSINVARPLFVHAIRL